MKRQEFKTNRNEQILTLRQKQRKLVFEARRNKTSADFLADMRSSDIQRVFSGLIGIKELSQKNKVENQEAQNFVPLILELLKKQEFPQIRQEAAQVLSKLNNYSFSKAVQLGIVPLSVELLRCDRISVVKKGLAIIQKCLDQETNFTQEIVKLNGVSYIMDVIDQTKSRSEILENILAPICDENILEKTQAKRVVIAFCQYFMEEQLNDIDYEEQILSLIDLQISSSLNIVKQIMETGIVSALVDAFNGCCAAPYVESAIQILLSIMNMEDSSIAIEEVMKCNILDGLSTMIEFRYIQISSSIVECIGVIGAHSQQCLKAIFAHSRIVDQIISLYQDSQDMGFQSEENVVQLKKEILKLFEDLLQAGESEQISKIYIQKEILSLFLDNFFQEDSEHQLTKLSGLKNILRFGQQHKDKDQNLFAREFVKIGGAAFIENILEDQHLQLTFESILQKIIEIVKSNNHRLKEFGIIDKKL